MTISFADIFNIRAEKSGQKNFVRLTTRNKEIIDVTSGSLNYHAFKEEVRRNLIAKRRLRCIIIKIIDYDTIYNTIGKEKITLFLSYIIKGLYSICPNDDRARRW